LELLPLANQGPGLRNYEFFNFLPLLVPYIITLRRPYAFQPAVDLLHQVLLLPKGLDERLLGSKACSELEELLLLPLHVILRAELHLNPPVLAVVFFVFEVIVNLEIVWLLDLSHVVVARDHFQAIGGCWCWFVSELWLLLKILNQARYQLGAKILRNPPVDVLLQAKVVFPFVSQSEVEDLEHAVVVAEAERQLRLREVSR